ncbi:hypothetical protein MBLNU230_g3294t1 [Neophaeotheca triangularis]
MSQQPQPPAYKTALLGLALENSILTFGTFTLKSGRQSPYFFNAGLFSTSKLISSLAAAYAQTLHAHTLADPTWGFDVLFGPAYKGIPLASCTAQALAGVDGEKYGSVGFAFNRKEAKTHGEGGSLIGQDLRGKRVVIVDDVITAGTAIREAIGVIEGAGGKLVGIVVAVDREERMPSAAEKEGRFGEEPGEGERGSAIGEVRRVTGVPVLSILTLGEMVSGLREMGRGESDEVRGMEEYGRKYRPSD